MHVLTKKSVFQAFLFNCIKADSSARDWVNLISHVCLGLLGHRETANELIVSKPPQLSVGIFMTAVV